MEAMEAILTRRSTRNYKPDAVEQEKLDKILDAARQAPSGGNNQTNHFFVIRSKEVLDKLADDLLVEGKFLTPWGLSMEELDSDWFEPSGRSIARGNIVPPSMLFICAGLLRSRRRDAGKIIAERYCAALMEQGMPFLIHPLNKGGYGFGGGGGSWPACVYTILCRMLTEIAE